MAEKEYDAGDEEQVKTRKTRAQLAKETEIEELRKLMKNKRARRLVWELLEYCTVFHSFGEMEPHQMAIASGRRDAGLWLLDRILAVDPTRS